MRESIKNAIGSTVRDLINSGEKTSFTAKELKQLGIQNKEKNLSFPKPKKESGFG